ncbi:hypothetical protein CKAH01_03738 [Colletotrichum kahawae]|uniref:Uncharacterized protein n=1 Tax=Colletotrichum kahawae TaxID=34407 RepID=A0AAE0DEA2_COLKA|nr:hypothetical protein CKAH01_03738 [Colletotrichum kahawae]
MPRSDAGSTTSVDEDLHVQKIHSKYVSSPRRLSAILKQNYGDVNYKVEMRHNYYSIKSPASERLIDIAVLRG